MRLKLFVLFTSVMLLSACSATSSDDTNTTERIKDTEATTQQATTTEATTTEEVTTSEAINGLVYENLEYGFRVSLPESWKDYTIVNEEWVGTALDAAGTDSENITGPKILIRHPLWTSEVERQDIPILVITIDQWQLLLEDKFHIGAAPIGPSELGRNDKYVFALPARYNFAYPEGFEEVETIINGKPLEAFNQ